MISCGNFTLLIRICFELIFLIFEIKFCWLLLSKSFETQINFIYINQQSFHNNVIFQFIHTQKDSAKIISTKLSHHTKLPVNICNISFQLLQTPQLRSYYSKRSREQKELTGARKLNVVVVFITCV